MKGFVRFMFCSLMMSAFFIVVGCSNNTDTSANEQPKQLTKQDVKEAIQEASQPGQFTKDAAEAYEANRGKVLEQMKGYSAEDEERKRIEAQKEYEEFQKKQAEKKAKQGSGN